MSRGWGVLERTIMTQLHEWRAERVGQERRDDMAHPYLHVPTGTAYGDNASYPVSSLCRRVARQRQGLVVQPLVLTKGGYTWCQTGLNQAVLTPAFKSAFSRALRRLIATGYLREVVSTLERYAYCLRCEAVQPTTTHHRCDGCWHETTARRHLHRIDYVVMTDKCILGES